MNLDSFRSFVYPIFFERKNVICSCSCSCSCSYSYSCYCLALALSLALAPLPALSCSWLLLLRQGRRIQVLADNNIAPIGTAAMSDFVMTLDPLEDEDKVVSDGGDSDDFVMASSRKAGAKKKNKKRKHDDGDGCCRAVNNLPPLPAAKIMRASGWW